MNNLRLLPHALSLCLLLLLAADVSAQIVERAPYTPTTDPRVKAEEGRFILRPPIVHPPPSKATQERRQVNSLLKAGERALKVSPPDYERAEAAFWHASDINPEEVRAYEGLGEVYAARGLHEKAVEAYEQAVRIKPKRPEAHFSLGVLYSRLGRKEDALAKGRTLRELKQKALADKLDALISGS